MRAERLPTTIWVLRGQRRTLASWSLAITAITLMYLSFWPTLGADDAMSQMIDGLPEALAAGMGWDRIGTAAGYLESTIYALLGVVLVLVAALGAAARAIAGEEEAGTLELEVSAPVSRRRLLLERYLAVVAVPTVLGLVLLAVVSVSVIGFSMDVALGNVAAATLGLWLFVLAIATVTFAVGAALGRRATALAAGAGLAVAAYVADALSVMVDTVAWLAVVSPFSWYVGGQPLEAGIDAVGLTALLGLTVAALLAGLVRFERRDLGV